MRRGSDSTCRHTVGRSADLLAGGSPKSAANAQTPRPAAVAKRPLSRARLRGDRAAWSSVPRRGRPADEARPRAAHWAGPALRHSGPNAVGPRTRRSKSRQWYELEGCRVSAWAKAAAVPDSPPRWQAGPLGARSRSRPPSRALPPEGGSSSREGGRRAIGRRPQQNSASEASATGRRRPVRRARAGWRPCGRRASRQQGGVQARLDRGKGDRLDVGAPAARPRPREARPTVETYRESVTLL